MSITDEIDVFIDLYDTQFDDVQHQENLYTSFKKLLRHYRYSINVWYAVNNRYVVRRSEGNAVNNEATEQDVIRIGKKVQAEAAEHSRMHRNLGREIDGSYGDDREAKDWVRLANKEIDPDNLEIIRQWKEMQRAREARGEKPLPLSQLVLKPKTNENGGKRKVRKTKRRKSIKKKKTKRRRKSIKRR